MLAITLGYHAQGNTAEPITLYVGRDAQVAYNIATAPPEGIVRTELIKHPVVTKRFTVPTVTETPAPVEAAPAEEAAAEEEAAPVEEAAAEEEAAPVEEKPSSTRRGRS